MSSSPLVSHTRLSPNHGGRRTHRIDTISIHCMAGDMSVEACGAWMAQKSTAASCNYCIGSDGRIGLIVDEGNRSWCTSSKSNDDRAITIEVANCGGAPDWPVTEKALDALVELLADICRRNGIPRLLWRGDKSLIGQVDKQNMTVHRWFKNKACPGDYLYSRHGQIAGRVNKKLEGEADMTEEQFDAMMQKWLDKQGKKPADWEKAAMEAAKAKGLLDGTRPKALITRGEIAQVLKNAGMC